VAVEDKGGVKMPDVLAIAPDRELTITYKGRTFDLVAYPVEDFGAWEATAHEQGTEGPSLPASEWGVPGLYRDPWTALSLLVDAIMRRIDGERAPAITNEELFQQIKEGGTGRSLD
jgi:hypothetical protein